MGIVISRYTGEDGIFLLRNGKFVMWKMKSSSLNEYLHNDQWYQLHTNQSTNVRCAYSLTDSKTNTSVRGDWCCSSLRIDVQKRVT